MSPLAVLSALLMAINFLPAPKEEFDAFARNGRSQHAASQIKDGRIRCVSVGTAGDRLAFIILEVGPKGGKPLTSAFSGGSGIAYTRPNGGAKGLNQKITTGELTLPNGTKFSLPRRGNVFELIDGQVRATSWSLTKDEAEAYQMAKTDGCSLEDLFRFVETRRKEAATKDTRPKGKDD